MFVLVEMLIEVQMTGWQSYWKGKSQTEIWSVFTMAGNSMVQALASKSHRSTLAQYLL
jgi:hypothetical protein